MAAPGAKEYVDLADLARRLAAYRYRVFTAATQLSEGLCIAVLYMVWQLVGYLWPSGPWAGPLALVVFFLSYFVPIYLLAGFVWHMYWKSMRGAGAILPYSRRESLIPLAYALPVMAVYILPPPLPHWYSYAWFYGLTIAHAIVALGYEVPMARRLPEYGTLSSRVTAALMAAASPLPALASLTSESSFLPFHVSTIIILVSCLVAAMVELKRAERLS